MRYRQFAGKTESTVERGNRFIVKTKAALIESLLREMNSDSKDYFGRSWCTDGGEVPVKVEQETRSAFNSVQSFLNRSDRESKFS